MSAVSQEFLDIDGLSRYDELIKERIPNLIPLTQAQYNTLSSAEKNDPDKYYFITDATPVANVNVLNDLANVDITSPAEDEILAYDSVNQKWVNRENLGGVVTFNGRNGSVMPVAGDYDADKITYDNSSSGLSATDVQDAIDELSAGTGVVSFNGRSGSVLPVSGDYNATQIPLSSTMSIGGTSKTNTEDALTALNNSKVECVTIETEQEWNNMSSVEKNDPSKMYFLPWDTSGSGGGSGGGFDVETDNLQDGDTLMYSSSLSTWTNSSNPIFPPPLVPWSTGTDEQITKMIQAYYNGVCTLNDIQGVWSIGDTREVDLSAITTSGTYNDNTWSVGESHRAQTIQLQILDFDHDSLTTSINGITKALITVDQKNCLRDASVSDTTGSSNTEHGYMNSSNTNVGGWTSCARRKWCNGGYYQALPEYLRLLIKPVNKLTSAGNQSATINTDSDYVFLLSEIEIFGSVTYSKSGEGSQYAWYANSTTNKNKLPKWNSSYVSDVWWERSPIGSNATGLCYVNGSGYAAGNDASDARGLAPAYCL